MENTEKFIGLDPRKLDKAMEKGGNDGGKRAKDSETHKMPVQDEMIMVTKDILNEMISSAVAAHMKMTKA